MTKRITWLEAQKTCLESTRTKILRHSSRLHASSSRTSAKLSVFVGFLLAFLIVPVAGIDRAYAREFSFRHNRNHERSTPTPTATAAPTAAPTARPTAAPTARPTAAPTARPTAAPTARPTAAPTARPTAAPTARPTAAPTAKPTASFTAAPTPIPTIKSSPTPSLKPTVTPTPAGSVLVTSDSSLNTGTAAAVTYTAPGSNSGIAIVTSKTNSNNQLWELFPDPFAIGSGNGTIKMAYSGTGSITTTVNLSGVDNQGVNAYPFIFYGGDQWGDQIGGQPPKFPAQLSSMSSLIGDIAYSLSGTTGGDMDITYDEWLIPASTYTGGIPGSLEVMVMPYFNFAYGPAGSFVKTFTEPVTVNGNVVNMNFQEYSTGTGGGNTVFFYAAPAQQVTSGEVRLNLLDFMKEGAATGGVGNSWWLAGIEFGTEFGDGATENFTFNVTKLDIEQTMSSGGS